MCNSADEEEVEVEFLEEIVRDKGPLPSIRATKLETNNENPEEIAAAEIEAILSYQKINKILKFRIYER